MELPHSDDYQRKAQALVDLWSRLAECAGLQSSLEFSYSLAEGNLHNPLPEPSDGERYFYHSDHLGSSAFITSENGYATQFLAYMPFGETLDEQQNSSNYYSPFKFSAKEKDPEMRSIREDHWKINLTEQTGHSYFGARYYSPELSVWLSVDPLSDKYPSLSPYNYCALNPVMLVDPDGRSVEGSGEGTPNTFMFYRYVGEANGVHTHEIVEVSNINNTVLDNGNLRVIESNTQTTTTTITSSKEDGIRITGTKAETQSRTTVQNADYYYDPERGKEVKSWRTVYTSPNLQVGDRKNGVNNVKLSNTHPFMQVATNQLVDAIQTNGYDFNAFQYDKRTRSISKTSLLISIGSAFLSPAGSLGSTAGVYLHDQYSNSVDKSGKTRPITF